MSKMIRSSDFTINTNDVDRWLVKSTGTTDFLTHGISNFTMQDPADNTKEVSFTLSGISTGTTRAIVFPNVNGTVVFNDNSATLTGKSIDFLTNTLTGTLAEFNTALADETFATLGGTEVLLAKTLTLPQINDVSSDHQYVFVVSELVDDRNVTLPLLIGDDEFTFNTHIATLVGKSIALGTNTITGTLAEFNTAITDDDILPVSGGELTGALTSTLNSGTAGAGTTAVENGDGFHHITVLTMAGVFPAITGDTAQAVGLLIYTFPAGVIVVDAMHMDVGITQSQGFINNDTPVVGVGTLIGTGSIALLSAGTDFDDYVSEIAAANCTGTLTDLSELTVNTPRLIEDGGTKTVHFNAADLWDDTAGGDTAATISGTVTITWRFLGA